MMFLRMCVGANVSCNLVRGDGEALTVTGIFPWFEVGVG